MSMEEADLQCEMAEGPEGLKQVLNTLLEMTRSDPDKGANGYYILYRLGNQRSLIKFDTSHRPYHFWYCDLLGRPATKAVKDTIAAFIEEKMREQEGTYDTEGR